MIFESWESTLWSNPECVVYIMFTLSRNILSLRKFKLLHADSTRRVDHWIILATSWSLRFTCWRDKSDKTVSVAHSVHTFDRTLLGRAIFTLNCTPIRNLRNAHIQKWQLTILILAVNGFIYFAARNYIIQYHFVQQGFPHQCLSRW